MTCQRQKACEFWLKKLLGAKYVIKKSWGGAAVTQLFFWPRHKKILAQCYLPMKKFYWKKNSNKKTGNSPWEFAKIRVIFEITFKNQLTNTYNGLKWPYIRVLSETIRHKNIFEPRKSPILAIFDHKRSLVREKIKNEK